MLRTRTDTATSRLTNTNIVPPPPTPPPPPATASYHCSDQKTKKKTGEEEEQEAGRCEEGGVRRYLQFVPWLVVPGPALPAQLRLRDTAEIEKY